MRDLWPAPAFWSQEKPDTIGALCTAALTPFAQAYGFIAAWRMQQAGFEAPLPVLCVGNLVVGGAGKTPMALALAERLIAAGERPWFLSRGYRSAAEIGPPLLVDAEKHLARDVGDEALLLARIAPTLVSADRVSAAKQAAAAGASILVLDDGMQNPALQKDWSLCLVDSEAGIGNGRCLPAGPLRAPLDAQLAGVSAVLLLGEGAQGERLAERAAQFKKPVLRGRLVIAADKALQLKGARVYAFAGIGRPEKFFASLAESGATLVGAVSFADHHAYRRDEIFRLQHAAKEQGALLVTTEKDFARLKPAEAFIDPTLPAPLAIPAKIEFSDVALFDDCVKRAITRARAGRLSALKS
ncbi:MAG: tetraacyldisaccharide 4'-kinase [Methylovirgula sp.]|jgi:tetraacyldisaccharide 4'-kinase